MKKIYFVVCGNHRQLKKPKYHTSSKKYQFFLSFAVSVKIKMKKYLKKKNQL